MAMGALRGSLRSRSLSPAEVKAAIDRWVDRAGATEPLADPIDARLAAPIGREPGMHETGRAIGGLEAGGA